MTQVDLALALGAALGSAFAFGMASALQHNESGRVGQRAALDPGLLGALARRPWWLVGFAADGLAVLLQAVALRYGPVTLVQPLLVAGLPAAVLLSCALARRHMYRDEVVGVLLCTLGLCAIGPTAATVGLAPQARRGAAIVAAVVLTALTLALLALASRRRSAAGISTGAAAGIVTGAGSVLLAVCAARVDNPARLMLSIAPYATVVVGLLGLLLSQAAFQTGSLGAPLAALSVVEPVVAVVLAVVVLHERLPTSVLSVSVGLVGVVLAVTGVLVLARSQEEHALLVP
jgi:uncharacterized membrane protein